MGEKLRHYEGLPALMRGQKTVARLPEDALHSEAFEGMDEDSRRIVEGLIKLLIDAEHAGIDAESTLAAALGRLTDALSHEGDENKNL